jgi:hypothetical protein
MLCEKRSKLGNQAFLLQRDIEVYNGSFISQALPTQSFLLQYELKAGKQTTKKNICRKVASHRGKYYTCFSKWYINSLHTIHFKSISCQLRHSTIHVNI